MTTREAAVERLGAKRCSRCGVLGEALATVTGHVRSKTEAMVVRDCCSAACAVAVLEAMFCGLARIANKKRGGVIASKQNGYQVGIWPRGRKRLGIERRAEEKKARRGS